jgi:hypothetical protein
MSDSTASIDDFELQRIDFQPLIEKLVRKLIEKYPPKDYFRTINITFTVGGIAGYYGLGLCALLNEMEKHGLVKVDKTYGASAGAYNCVFLACKLDINKLLNAYDTYRITQKQEHDIMGECNKKSLYKYLPSDVHLKCNEKVNITRTNVTNPIYPHRTVINTYKSRDELIQGLLSSSYIPYVMGKDMYYVDQKGNKYIDGFFPIVNNDDKNLMLYVNFLKVEYPRLPLLLDGNPHEPYIDPLVLKGIYDAYNFLDNTWADASQFFDKSKMYHNSFKWIHKEKKQSSIKSRLTFLSFLMIFNFPLPYIIKYIKLICVLILFKYRQYFCNILKNINLKDYILYPELYLYAASVQIARYITS